jgi:transposase-like protein
MKYVTWKDLKAVTADLKPVYRVATADEAERRLSEFEAK